MLQYLHTKFLVESPASIVLLGLWLVNAALQHSAAAASQNNADIAFTPVDHNAVIVAVDYAIHAHKASTLRMPSCL